MNDVELYVYFEGEVPASVRPLLAALREVETPLPTPEAQARVIAKGLAAIDARLARIKAGDPEAEREAEEAARGSAPPVVVAEPVAPVTSVASVASVAAPPSVDEVRAAAKGRAPLGFEAWAAMSIHFIGAGPNLAALTARGLTPEEWGHIDEDYLRVLSADLRAGRRERPLLYEAKYNAELERRASASEARAAERARPPMPAVVQAPASLTGTVDPMLVGEAVWVAMGKLPFVEASGPPSPEMGVHGVLKTQPSRAVSSNLGLTMPLDEVAMRKAVAPAVPFVGSQGAESAAGAATVVYFPALTVPQWVSLCMELLENPGLGEGIRKKYGVPSGGAAWRAMQEHWRRLLETPEVRAEHDAEVAAYGARRRAVAR